jgi:predicted nucleic acid-binding protein
LIYLDTSVALAHLFAEDHRPADELWSEPLVSSRLLEYEAWVRVNARSAGRTHGDALRELLARVALVELVPPILERALSPFPVPVRTLDALHLASIEFLRGSHLDVRLATYDTRLEAAARALGVPIAAV